MKTKMVLGLLLLLIALATLASCGAGCDPGYRGVCIPPPPPDLNCEDIEFRNFEVVGRDSHGLDGDNDGRGCE